MGKETKIEVVFGVRMMLPEGATIHDVQKYLRSAIASHGGGLDIDDPFFGIEDKDFTVALQQKKSVTTYIRKVRTTNK